MRKCTPYCTLWVQRRKRCCDWPRQKAPTVSSTYVRAWSPPDHKQESDFSPCRRSLLKVCFSQGAKKTCQHTAVVRGQLSVFCRHKLVSLWWTVPPERRGGWRGGLQGSVLPRARLPPSQGASVWCVSAFEAWSRRFCPHISFLMVFGSLSLSVASSTLLSPQHTRPPCQAPVCTPHRDVVRQAPCAFVFPYHMVDGWCSNASLH